MEVSKHYIHGALKMPSASSFEKIFERTRYPSCVTHLRAKFIQVLFTSISLSVSPFIFRTLQTIYFTTYDLLLSGERSFSSSLCHLVPRIFKLTTECVLKLEGKENHMIRGSEWNLCFPFSGKFLKSYHNFPPLVRHVRFALPDLKSSIYCDIYNLLWYQNCMKPRTMEKGSMN